VDPSIRLLQPQDEQEFVASLAESHLSTVTRQTLKKYKTEGLHHLAGHKAQESHFDLFKEETSKLQLYKEANCWYVMPQASCCFFPRFPLAN